MVLKKVLWWGLLWSIFLNFNTVLLGQPSLAEHLQFPGGTIYSVLRDSKGFMWFGTSTGLYRYDGYTTLVYKHEPVFVHLAYHFYSDAQAVGIVFIESDKCRSRRYKFV